MFTALALLVAASPFAVSPSAPDASSPPLAKPDAPAKPAPRFGVLVDAGVPEGVGASFAWLPWSWLRLQAGPATNGIALGGRAAASLMFPRGIVRPTLTFGAGRFAEGDARRVLQIFAPNLSADVRALERVAHDFTDAHAGLEIGSPSGASFFLRGGVSRSVFHLPALPEILRSEAGDATSQPGPATLSVVAPSLQLGFVLYLP
jgi:hypothetical protein